MSRKKTLKVFCVRVGHDSTGPHLEYYGSARDFAKGIGYPVDELPDDDREALLLALVEGRLPPAGDERQTVAL